LLRDFDGDGNVWMQLRELANNSNQRLPRDIRHRDPQNALHRAVCTRDIGNGFGNAAFDGLRGRHKRSPSVVYVITVRFLGKEHDADLALQSRNPAQDS
jgi:hypothetical protein